MSTMRVSNNKRALIVALLFATAGCSRNTEIPERPPASAANLKSESPVVPPAPSEPETFDNHRFLLLSRRPVLVELQVNIDGHAPTQNLTPLLDYVLAASDTDDDQKSTWPELMANNSFVRSPLIMPATAPLGSDEEPEPPDTELWPSQYDINSDDIVDRDEVLPFITDFQFNQLVSFESGPSYGDDQHYESAILRIVDANKNEQFDEAELAALELRLSSAATPQAPSTLMAYDYNDDESVTMAELAGLEASPEMIDGMMTAAPSTNHGIAALMLHHDRAWIRNHFLLKKRYGAAGSVSAESVGIKMFGALNRNEDNKIDENELQALCTIEPDITVQVRFDSEHDTMTSDDPTFDATSQSSGQFRNSDITLACGLMDGASSFPDSKTNKPNEIASPRQAVACVAANRIHVSIHDEQDAVFRLLDENGDQRLSLREVRLAKSAIERCDKNQDGITFVEEINAGMQIGVRRGGNNSELTPSEPRPVLTSPNRDAPEWFVAMDQNGDGELSRREFLGTSTSFDGLDKDGDEVLSPAEVAAE